MKDTKGSRCNHCGGLMRVYMDGSPTCINCGRYIEHNCKSCVSTSSRGKGRAKKAKRMSA